jgi:hypothetical protein
MGMGMGMGMAGQGLMAVDGPGGCEYQNCSITGSAQSSV